MSAQGGTVLKQSDRNSQPPSVSERVRVPSRGHEPVHVEPQSLCDAAVADIRERHPNLHASAPELFGKAEDEVVDSGIKAVLRRADSSEQLGLLVVSSAVDPASAARCVAKTQEVKDRLGPDTGSVVIEPLASGEVFGRAYVLWPFHRALNPSRIANFARRVSFYPRICRWLLDVARTTARPVASEQFDAMYGEPLLLIADEREFPAAMRDAAVRTLVRLKSRQFQPRSVVEHNDFWTGNILRPHPGSRAGEHPRGFIVIDWEGARLAGYPALDLVRFSVSAGMPDIWLRHELAKLRTILQCDAADMLGYTLAGLGAMGQRLGYFPVERYRALAIETFEAVAAVL